MIDAVMTWPKMLSFLQAGVCLKSLFLVQSGFLGSQIWSWASKGKDWMFSGPLWWSSSVVAWTGGVFVYNDRQSVDVKWEVILICNGVDPDAKRFRGLQPVPWCFRSKSNYCGTKWFISIVWLTDFGFKSADWLCALDNCITLCCAEDRLPRAQTWAITHAPFSRDLCEQESTPPFSLTWVSFRKWLFFFSFSYILHPAYLPSRLTSKSQTYPRTVFCPLFRKASPFPLKYRTGHLSNRVL